MSSPYVPYCGSPPVPAELWSRWNLDPVLLVGLAALALLYVWGSAGVEPRRRAAFGVGWALVAVALVSPLCNLTVALFSARVGQHMLLLLVAAPLLVVGRAAEAWARTLPRRLTRSAPVHMAAAVSGNGLVAAGLFTLLLWGWHMPPFYDATLRGDAAYWAMHLSLFGSGLLVWHRILPRRHEDALAGVLLGFAVATQMSLLGALLTFAPTVWFASHLATAWPWGLAPLDDQRLGGLIMWLPGGFVFAGASLASLAALFAWLDRPRDTPDGAATRYP